jgi:hypothetical protein
MTVEASTSPAQTSSCGVGCFTIVRDDTCPPNHMVINNIARCLAVRHAMYLATSIYSYNGERLSMRHGSYSSVS